MTDDVNCGATPGSAPAMREDVSPGSPRRPAAGLVLVALAALTFAAFHAVGGGDFVNLDDDAYVQFQPLVNQGFRPAAVAWAFTGTHSNNWHPLTTLSHQLDCAWFGVRPGPMHWVNFGWHLANTLLVFLVGRSLTGATWRSAAVAAVFAVHPLHVESVAWISERKDVLSGFFWLLGLGAYGRYARAPSLFRYGLVGAAMVLALLSKPMAVTFPCVLLLLDYWPLRRWPERSWRALVVEKLPLFGLVAAHSAITFVVQRSTGAAQFGERFSLGDRLGNAVVSYVRYLGKALWPESLAPMYLHPGSWPLLTLAGAGVLLAAISLWAWRTRATRPWWIVGWLWFLGTLVPVIGIVQVGAQAMADRYMYLPILGLLLIGAWELARGLDRFRVPRLAVGAAVALVLAALAFVSARQVRAWRSSTALYEHCIRIGEDNAAVRYLYAVALQLAGRPLAESVEQFNRSLTLRPDYVNARTQLASIAFAQNQPDVARRLIEETLRQDPGNPGLHVNLGAYWQRAGRPDEAVRHYEEALRLDRTLASAHLELARILLSQQKLAEAGEHLRIRAEVDRWNPDALADYGNVLVALRRFDEARRFFSRALWIQPNSALAQQGLKALEAAKS